MRCADCAEGKRITSRKVLCIAYGMILPESHECGRPAAREKEKAADGGTPADLPEAEERNNYAEQV